MPELLGMLIVYHRIDETLDCLKGALLFSSIDLKAGYWQVEMDEDSKALTAFTVRPLGLYKCERMPFGLTNAPALFNDSWRIV